MIICKISKKMEDFKFVSDSFDNEFGAPLIRDVYQKEFKKNIITYEIRIYIVSKNKMNIVKINTDNGNEIIYVKTKDLRKNIFYSML